MSWFHCSGCGATRRCDTCGATECAQNLSRECPGCRKVLAQPRPWFLGDAESWHGRPSKAARKLRSRAERHRRLFRRHNPPAKFGEADWG